MNKINHRITLDVQKGGVQKVLRGMFAGEVLSRRIVVSLVAGSSVCSMDENTTAVMYVTKPNGVTNYGACTIEDNLVFYDVLQADVDAPGITQMQLKILSGDMVLYAPMFSVEVQESRTSDTQASETPTYTALEQALAQATEVYNTRVVSIDVTEDLTFVVTYGDDSTYESEAIKNAIANIDDAESERVAAEHDRAEAFSKMEYAEQEREVAEKERAEAFTNMQTAVQGALDVTVNLQGEVQSLIDANGVTVEDKENWDGKADGLSYVGSKLSLLNGDEVLKTVEIIGGGGGAVVIPDKVLTATNVTATEAITPVLNAELFGSRSPEAYALKEELTAHSVPRLSFDSQTEIETFVNNYSVSFDDGIFYEFEVNGVAEYELSEGVWYISGTKTDSLYETQAAKRYCPDGVEVKRRSKYEGTWSGWVADVNELDLTNIKDGTTQVGNAKTLDGHEAEYFFPKTGGNVDGHVIAYSDTDAVRSNGVRNSKQGLFLQVLSDGTARIITDDGGLLASRVNGINTFDGTASGNLPLNGGGTVKAAYMAPVALDNTASDVSLTVYKGKGALLGYLGMSALNKPCFQMVDGTRKELLHTGNKPTGTYTGNGSATSRTIQTNAVGRAVCIRNNNDWSFVVVYSNGYFGKDKNGSFVSGSDCSTGSGTIVLTTASEILNASGVQYTYEYL